MAAGVQQFFARPHDELERRSSSLVLPSSSVWQVRTRNLGSWGVLREKKSAVPQPSTDRALRRLTSEFGRDPVYLLWYSRWRQSQTFVSQTFVVAETTHGAHTERAHRVCTPVRTQSAHTERARRVSVCTQCVHAGYARRARVCTLSERRRKAGRCCEAVPQPSTDRALQWLTSEVGRGPAYSLRHGRWRAAVFSSSS